MEGRWLGAGLVAVGVSASLSAGCAERLRPEGGPADKARFDEGSVEAALILRAANTLSHPVLDDEVGLDRRAADNIVATRAGDDGVEGTEDDTPFATLEALDAVSYVGPVALQSLYDYAYALWGGTVHGYDEGSEEAVLILGVANGEAHDALEERVGLSALAACSVFGGRVGPDGVAETGDDTPYDSLVALASQVFVDGAAFDALYAYALEQASLEDCPPDTILSSDGVSRFTTLADALAGSPAGTVLDVCEGTFYGDRLIARDVTLRGRGVGATVLHQPGRYALMSVRGTVTLRALTLRGPGADAEVGGGSVVVGETHALVAEDVRFTEIYNGAMSVSHGDVSLTDVTFDNNTSANADSAAIRLSASTLTGERVAFVDNATIASGSAGALYADQSEIVLDEATFHGNDGDDIGAVYLYYSSLIARDTDFGAGASDNLGGDLSIQGTIYHFDEDVSVACEDVCEAL